MAGLSETQTRVGMSVRAVRIAMALVAGGTCGVGGGVGCGAALADSVTAHVTGQKDVTWDFLGRVAAPPQNIVGSWSARAHTYAICAHGVSGEFESKGSGTWNGANGFTGPKLVAPKASVTHATADAWVQMSASAAAAAAGPAPAGFTHYNVSISKAWEETPAAVRDPQGSSYAKAGAHGKASLSAGGATRFALNGTVNGVGINPVNGRGDGTGASGGARGQRGRVHDPISITVINDLTQQSATEQLFTYDVDAVVNDGSAGWSFSGGRLTLSGGTDASGLWSSSVVFTGEASSSWLVNPLGGFGASLVGGAFSATGYWAGAWQLTSDGMGHVTQATIDLGAMAWDLKYVIPDSVLGSLSRGSALTPEETFTQVLESTFDSEAEAWNVPTPGTVSLLGAGVVVLATAWRRR